MGTQVIVRVAAAVDVFDVWGVILKTRGKLPIPTFASRSLERRKTQWPTQTPTPETQRTW